MAAVSVVGGVALLSAVAVGISLIVLKLGRPKLVSRRYSKVVIKYSRHVISKSMGPSEKLRDTRTSTYQIAELRLILIELPNFTNEHVI